MIYRVDIDLRSPDDYEAVLTHFDGRACCQLLRAEAWAWRRNLLNLDYSQGATTPEREGAKIALVAVIVESASVELQAMIG